jgi:hypothetical protein
MVEFPSNSGWTQPLDSLLSGFFSSFEVVAGWVAPRSPSNYSKTSWSGQITSLRNPSKNIYILTMINHIITINMNHILIVYYQSMVGCMPTAGCVYKNGTHLWNRPQVDFSSHLPAGPVGRLRLLREQASGYPLVILSPHFLPVSVSFCIPWQKKPDDICWYFHGNMV